MYVSQIIASEGFVGKAVWPSRFFKYTMSENAQSSIPRDTTLGTGAVKVESMSNIEYHDNCELHELIFD